MLLALLGLGLSIALGSTFGEVSSTCPLDGTTFTWTASMSGTSFGQRLDLRPIGPIASPWPVAVCPKDHFVLFDDKLDPDTIERARAVVATPEYQALAATESSYYLLATLQRGLGRPESELGWLLLQASWQVEADAARNRRYLEEALAAYQASLATGKLSGEERLTADLLAGELERRLGRFAEAKARFTRLQGEKPAPEGVIKRIIDAQLSYTAAGDSAPHEVPREK